MTLKDNLKKLSLTRIRQIVAKYNRQLRISGHSKLGKEELIGHILNKSNLNLQLINRLTNEALLHGRAQKREKAPRGKAPDLFSTIGNLLQQQGFPLPQITEPEVLRPRVKPRPGGLDLSGEDKFEREDIPEPEPVGKLPRVLKRPGGLDLSKHKFFRADIPEPEKVRELPFLSPEAIEEYVLKDYDFRNIVGTIGFQFLGLYPVGEVDVRYATNIDNLEYFYYKNKYSTFGKGEIVRASFFYGANKELIFGDAGQTPTQAIKNPITPESLREKLIEIQKLYRKESKKPKPKPEEPKPKPEEPKPKPEEPKPEEPKPKPEEPKPEEPLPTPDKAKTVEAFVDMLIAKKRKEPIPFICSGGVKNFLYGWLLNRNVNMCPTVVVKETLRHRGRDQEILITSNPYEHSDFGYFGGNKQLQEMGVDRIINEIVKPCIKNDKMPALLVGIVGHANSIIVNPYRATVEYYEPHGVRVDRPPLGGFCKKLASECNRQGVSKKTGKAWSYVPPNDFCIKPGRQGLQALAKERGIDKTGRSGSGIMFKEAKGFCCLFSILFLDMRLKFPMVAPDEFMGVFTEKFGTDKTEEVVYMMRGLFGEAIDDFEEKTGDLLLKYPQTVSSIESLKERLNQEIQKYFS